VVVDVGGAPGLGVVDGGAAVVLHALVAEWEDAVSVDDGSASPLHRDAVQRVDWAVGRAVAPALVHQVAVVVRLGGAPGPSIVRVRALVMNLAVVLEGEDARLVLVVVLNTETPGVRLGRARLLVLVGGAGRVVVNLRHRRQLERHLKRSHRLRRRRLWIHLPLHPFASPLALASARHVNRARSTVD